MRAALYGKDAVPANSRVRQRSGSRRRRVISAEPGRRHVGAVPGAAEDNRVPVAPAKFVGLLIWGKYIARFLDGKVWEVRETPPRKDITHGSKVTLIEAKTKLKDSNSSKNLWRICFTATFEGYETFSKSDFW